MKRTLAGLVTAAALALGMIAQPLPAAAVTVNVPDVELRACINAELGNPEDAAITDVAMRSITTLSCWGEFRSITGLQYATNIEELDLAFGALSGALTLPQQWTRLRTLDLWSNALTSVTVPSTLTSLRMIDVSDNELTSFSLPTNLAQIEEIYLDNNSIGSLHQLSWLPREVLVSAYNQTVTLPAWTTGKAYPLVSRKRDGSNTTLTLPAGVTRTSSGLVYAKAGTFSLSFQGDDTNSFNTVFSGRFVQTVTAAPTTPTRRALGDHTGDGIADVYGADSAGNLLLYRGSTSGSFSLVGQRGTGWQTISYLTQVADMNGDGWSDLLARKRADNTLWVYTAGANGTITGSRQIGNGWGIMDQIIPAGNLAGGSTQYLLARETSTGYLYRYTFSNGALSNKTKIGYGWNTIRQFLSVGDFTGDGRSDVLGIDMAGQLWVYAGTTSGTLGTRRQVGYGWGTFTQAFSPGDVTGDGRPDLIGRSSAGVVYVYANRMGSWGTKRQVMYGTQSFLLLA
ncbi:FG-GAP-like repeat-containing protein [Aestuariimicrobium soli]|uniref:FG-GAP-like repeat-containing protein n=1 Tax=Aestuariimicrobium soli TaxID=2035834 RepID=UPI003EBA7962